ncbi:hypothetical protein [Sphingopyxis granuli]|uniref:hypothetical protein n=1 Tax=Sphingopyxis granuli TaxID=267128 RepID=UPI00301C102E
MEHSERRQSLASRRPLKILANISYLRLKPGTGRSGIGHFLLRFEVSSASQPPRSERGETQPNGYSGAPAWDGPG